MILKPIPTHVVTGFLGVGKTSFIQYLLAHKPADETWAVLVNEFGEIGIDGELLKGEGDDVAIKEVAGGCLCCAAGVPTQVAVNQLIAKARPDRLFIEPTGLGHPKAIVETLSQGHFKPVLSMRASLCLVDPRKLNDPRYLESELFTDQLSIADLILANKMDLASLADLQQLEAYLKQQSITAEVLPVQVAQLLSAKEASLYQYLEKHYFARPTAWRISKPVNSTGSSLLGSRPAMPFDEADDARKLSIDEQAFDELGIYRASNRHEGRYTLGWVFDCRYEFDFEALVAWVKAQDCLRLKAVMITDEGIAAFNYVDGQLGVMELDDSLDSRLEMIAEKPQPQAEIEQALLSLTKRLSN
ncbi:CobW family GTP-binding protein [Shewanella aegiceratis]|uniref:CobW family GTP-binding protein n=1 Tax=Shewanella aegiceratis TaxID=2864203 RepID=UPI001C65BB53|nr:CobW family GTP-binding protein [Shewanella aegiceratis]QYJ81451.1 GTP-binding protein [Shewanella aegiceratis]